MQKRPPESRLFSLMREVVFGLAEPPSTEPPGRVCGSVTWRACPNRAGPHPPELLIQEAWGGAGVFAFLNKQFLGAMLMLLVW